MHFTGDVSARPQEDFLRRACSPCRMQNSGADRISRFRWKGGLDFSRRIGALSGRECRKESMAEMPCAAETKVFLQKTEESKAIGRLYFLRLLLWGG
ncbi:MAG: hypothetical protein IJ418_13055 [Clostridia bacterium]|nr:hypothetical protein [Clostridia bacterium]